MKKILTGLLILLLSGCGTNSSIDPDYTFNQSSDAGLVFLGIDNEVDNVVSVDLLLRKWSKSNNNIEGQIPGINLRFRTKWPKEGDFPGFFIREVPPGSYALAGITVAQYAYPKPYKTSICFAGGTVVFDIKPKEISYIGNILATFKPFTERSEAAVIIRPPIEATLKDYNFEFSGVEQVKEFLARYPKIDRVPLSIASSKLNPFAPGKDIFGNNSCRGAA